MPRLPVLVPLAMATGALLAGCGSSGSTADSPAVVPPSGAAAQSSTHPSGAADAAPTVSGSAGVTATNAPGGASPAQSPAAGTTGAQSPVTGRVPLPPPGSYTYTVHGSSTSALGSQSLNGDSTLSVETLSSNRERSTQRDKGGSTQETMVGRASGLYLADIHLSQSGFDEDFKPANPVLLFPASAHKGQQWHWQMKSTDGNYTLTAQLTLADLHSSATDTHGQRYQTVTLDSVLHMHSSDIDLTIHQQDQASRNAMIVHEHAVTDGTAYGTHFHSNATRVLARRPG